MSLRFVERAVPAPSGPEIKTVRVLQQLFVPRNWGGDARDEWRDVPMVRE